MTDTQRELPDDADDQIADIAELLAPIYADNRWKWIGDPKKRIDYLVVPDAARIALTLARLATEVTPGGSLGTGRLTAIHTRPTPNDPDETIGLYLHLGDLHLNQHTPDGPERHQEPRTPLPVPRDITHSDTPTPESN